jgi:hypothetical protein
VSWGGFLTGLILLALAQPVLSGAAQHQGTLADLAALPAKFVTKFMDPTVPAFGSPAPTLASSSSTSSSSSSSTTKPGTGQEAA